LSVRPDYVLTDGFPIDGLGVPGLAIWKGDQVAACVAAASVIAKVTRDRIMCELSETFPQYGFEEHKGYATPEHSAALAEHGVRAAPGLLRECGRGRGWAAPARYRQRGIRRARAHDRPGWARIDGRPCCAARATGGGRAGRARCGER